MSKAFDRIKEGLEEAIEYAKGNIRIGTRRLIDGTFERWDGKVWVKEQKV